MPMNRPQSLSQDAPGSRRGRSVLAGLGVLVIIGSTPACYRATESDNTDADANSASDPEKESAPRDTARGTGDTVEDVLDTVSDSRDTGSSSRDTGDTSSPFCAGRAPGETSHIAELYEPSASIAMDEASVYIVGRDGEMGENVVWRIDKVSGDKEALAAAEDRRSDLYRRGVIALDDTHLYIGDSAGNLTRLPKTGGPPEIHPLGLGGIHGLVENGGGLYFRTASSPWSEDGRLWHVMADVGSMPTMRFEGISAFDIHDGILYFVQLGILSRQPVEGGGQVEFFGGIEALPFLLVVVEGESIFLFDESAALRVETDGLYSETLPWPVEGEDIPGFAADGDDAYWTNRDGELWHGVVSDPEKTNLMDRHGPYDDEDYASVVAVDGDTVYWTAAPDGTPRYYDEGPFNLYRTCR
jgi:hypothetical protein